MQALWSNEHALAWHLGQDFRADPVTWARGQCQAWEELEDQLPNFLEELPDCPCTLAQARADSGRFHVSPCPLPPTVPRADSGHFHVSPCPPHPPGWGPGASEGARGARTTQGGQTEAPGGGAGVRGPWWEPRWEMGAAEPEAGQLTAAAAPQTDYGCDVERGSVCTYHPGAVHCVRSVQAR